MTTDLSQYDPNVLPGADVLKHQRYAIIVADWNSDITFAMAEGARQTLIKHGVDEDNISLTHVPGTVEDYGIYISALIFRGNRYFRNSLRLFVL